MSNFGYVAAFVMSALATARITRLIVFDRYPPSVWIRTQWDRITRDGDWAELVHCGYCASMYIAPVVVLTGWLSGWHTAWWIVTGILSVAYLGAITTAYDGED